MAKVAVLGFVFEDIEANLDEVDSPEWEREAASADFRDPLFYLMLQEGDEV